MGSIKQTSNDLCLCPVAARPVPGAAHELGQPSVYGNAGFCIGSLLSHWPGVGKPCSVSDVRYSLRTGLQLGMCLTCPPRWLFHELWVRGPTEQSSVPRSPQTTPDPVIPQNAPWVRPRGHRAAPKAMRERGHHCQNEATDVDQRP